MTDADLNNPKGEAPEKSRPGALEGKPETDQHDAPAPETAEHAQVDSLSAAETVQPDATETESSQHEETPVGAEVPPEVDPVAEPETIRADAPASEAEMSQHEETPVEREVPAEVDPAVEPETIESDAAAETEDRPAVDPIAEPEAGEHDEVLPGTWTFQHGALIPGPKTVVSEASSTEAVADEPEAASAETVAEVDSGIVAERHAEGVPYEAAHEAVAAEVNHPYLTEPDVVEPPPPMAPPGSIPPPAIPPEPKGNRTNTAILLIGVVLAVVVLSTLGVVGYVFYERGATAPTDSTSAAPEPATPTVTKDLGTVDSSAVGLKGHLTTKWDSGLGYNFVVEADNPSRQAGFAATASNPMRPATITIQIKNSYGVVMCSQDVLLKFNPRKAAAVEEPVAEKPTGKREAKAAAAKEAEREADREADLDRQETDEANREQGKSLFQVNSGPNGTVDSISSQGQIPCPQAAYEGMGYWSFLPDFPTPDEQADWAERSARAATSVATKADADAAATSTPVAPGQNKRAPSKAAGASESFSIAGDDSIIEYDPATGKIGTRGGKVFSIERAGTAAQTMEGYDLPVKIHYSCDQTATCTLTRGGAIVAHARLSR